MRLTKDLEHVKAIDFFIPAAVKHANREMVAHPVSGDKEAEYDTWSRFYHAEMDRLTIGAGLRVKLVA